MSYQPLSVDDLRDLIHRKEATDPLVFLESVMNGQDPRRLSSIYELILEIDSFTGGDIGSGDWAEIVDHVSTRYKYHTVPMSDSMSAAKTIAEYLHPKRKQIELGGNNVGDDVASSPLTAEEIELFKEKFNEEF